MMERDKFMGLLRRAARAHQRAQFACDTQLILPIDVDEVSLLFATPEELALFTATAKHDWRTNHFGTVDVDTMQMTGGPSFEVRFEFLRLADAPWRIEAMCVLDGEAPLHAAALSDRGSGCVVHASYRAGTSLPDYNRELDRLPEYGALRAKYTNTYGQFSYWQVGDLGHVYLKPRVNLRDNMAVQN